MASPQRPGGWATPSVLMRVLMISFAVFTVVLIDRYSAYTSQVRLLSTKDQFSLFGWSKRLVTVVAVAPPDMSPEASSLHALKNAMKSWTSKGSESMQLVLVLPSVASVAPADFHLTQPHMVVQPCPKGHSGGGCRPLVAYTDLINYGAQFAGAPTTHLLLLNLAYAPDENIVTALIKPLEDDPNVHIAGATLTMDDDGTEIVLDHGISVGHGWFGNAWEQYLLRNLNGFTATDHRARVSGDVVAVSPYMMMVRYSTWTGLRGMRKLTTSPQEQLALGSTTDDALNKQGLYLKRKLFALGGYIQVAQRRASLSMTFQHRGIVESAKATAAQAIGVIETVDGSFDADGGAERAAIASAQGDTTIVSLDDADLFGRMQSLTDELRMLMVAVTERILDGVKGVQEEGGWDLCFRVRRRNLRVVVVEAKAKLNVATLPPVMRPLRKKGTMLEAIAPPSLIMNGPFARLWNDSARGLWPGRTNTFGQSEDFAVKKRSAENPMMRVVWQAFCCKCCGFANEILHLVFPLQKYHAIDLIPAPDCFCQGYPNAVMDTLARMHLPTQNLQTETSDDEIVVWISHTDPGSYLTHDLIRKKPTYVVGRSMYEFTKIPDRWVHECRDNADEIWVPSQFVRDVWIDNGVSPDKVVLIPEAIDVYFFDPEVAGTIEFPLADSMKHYNSRPNIEDQGSRFKFLSHFKWEDRKGWDVLCNAYFSSFTKDDPVTLVILTHIWFPGPPETHGDSTNHTFVRMEIVKYVKKALGKNEADLAHFVIVTSRLSEADVAALYNSADAFVMPTKGEGWGLPPLQAMSMGVPTATTNWSGSVDFLNPDYSFPIPPDRIEEIPLDSYYGYVPGKKWAQASIPETARIMKYMADKANKKRLQEMGRRARKYVVEHLSEEAVARLVSNRLMQIKDIIRTKSIPHRDPKDWR